jgi:WD40 repeat protein
VYAWPIDSDAQGRKATVAKKDVRDVALHPSGRWVLVACGSPDVSIWDTTTWKCARTHNWGVGAVEFVNFSPDGTLAATASEQKAVVWDWDL